jgi:hypothetical protein
MLAWELNLNQEASRARSGSRTTRGRPWACVYASSQGSRRVISYYSFHDHAVLHRFEGHGQFRVTRERESLAA